MRQLKGQPYRVSSNKNMVAMEPEGKDKPAQYRNGRKCRLCHKLLSIYNPGPNCRCHNSQTLMKQAEHKYILEQTRKHNEVCRRYKLRKKEEAAHEGSTKNPKG